MDIAAIHSLSLTVDEQAAIFALVERVDLAWGVLMSHYGHVPTDQGETLLLSGESRLVKRGILTRTALGFTHLAPPFDHDTCAISSSTVVGCLSSFDGRKPSSEELMIGGNRFAALSSENTNRGRFSFGPVEGLLGYALRVASANVASEYQVTAASNGLAGFIEAIANESSLALHEGSKWEFPAQWPQQLLALCEEHPNGFPVAILTLKNSRVIELGMDDDVSPDGVVEITAYIDRCAVSLLAPESGACDRPGAVANSKICMEIV